MPVTDCVLDGKVTVVSARGRRVAVDTAVLLVLALACIVAGCSGGSGDDERADGAPATATTAAVTGCATGSSVAPGTERLAVASAGGPREVERMVPPGYDGTTRLPLIVDLHGATSTIDQQDLFSNLPAEAAKRGYVLLTPQAAPATLSIGGQEINAPFWNLTPGSAASIPGAQDDIGFLAGLIDSTVSDLCIDDARIYVTGFSNGAGLSAALACAMPGRLAAIAPVSGINLASTCGDLQPVSVIAFHGDADPLVPYEGGSAAGVEIGNPSVAARVREFAIAAGCTGDPSPSPAPAPADIVHSSWTGCRPGAAVELFTVVGGGHTWPGMLNYIDAAKLSAIAANQRLVEAAHVDLAQVAGHMTTDLEATQAMLDFFDAHRRP